MQLQIQVLSEDEKAQVHERTLTVLSTFGVRCDTAEGRRILAAAGALVDEQTRMVRFPPELVESLLAQATRRFTVHGRRPGWSFPVGAGAFTLLADGGATAVFDAATGERRPSTADDWRAATRLLDALGLQERVPLVRIDPVYAALYPEVALRAPGDGTRPRRRDRGGSPRARPRDAAFRFRARPRVRDRHPRRPGPGDARPLRSDIILISS